MLNEFIKNNKEQFQTEDLSKDHINRFQRKLHDVAISKNRKTRTIIEYMAVASVILFFSGVIIYQNKHQDAALTPNDQSISKNEFNEASYYYENQINQQYNQLITNCLNDNEHLITEIESDIDLLNSDYNQLLEEYKENPYDERVKSAIIMVYQQKLEILNLIIEKTCSTY